MRFKDTGSNYAYMPLETEEGEKYLCVIEVQGVALQPNTQTWGITGSLSFGSDNVTLDCKSIKIMKLEDATSIIGDIDEDVFEAMMKDNLG